MFYFGKLEISFKYKDYCMTRTSQQNFLKGGFQYGVRLIC